MHSVNVSILNRCKTNVNGDDCSKCVDGYFNFTSDGCTECQCNVMGSESISCDNEGQCDCKVRHSSIHTVCV